MAEIKLGVYRRLDDRLLPPGATRDTLERQRRNERRAAIEALFGESPDLAIVDDATIIVRSPAVRSTPSLTRPADRAPPVRHATTGDRH